MQARVSSVSHGVGRAIEVLQFHDISLNGPGTHECGSAVRHSEFARDPQQDRWLRQQHRMVVLLEKSTLCGYKRITQLVV